MAIPFSQRVRSPGDVLMRELDDESVLLHLNREVCFGLDDVGTRMGAALVSADLVQAAWEALVDEYDVEPKVLRRDLEELLPLLIDYGLLVSDEEEAS